MEKKTIDFGGISTLESSVIPRLDSYLSDKQNQTIEHLSRVISHLSREEVVQSHTIEALELEVAQLRGESLVVTNEQWRRLSDNINTILWEYTDVINGCTIEFSKQIKQSNFQKWDNEVFQVIEGIYGTLKEHIETALSILHRVEKMLRHIYDM